MQQRSIKKKNVIVHNDRGDTIRLNKYISESGFCSRREADKLIESGLVTICLLYTSRFNLLVSSSN